MRILPLARLGPFLAVTYARTCRRWRLFRALFSRELSFQENTCGSLIGFGPLNPLRKPSTTKERIPVIDDCGPEKAGVGGSIPSLATILSTN